MLPYQAYKMWLCLHRLPVCFIVVLARGQNLKLACLYVYSRRGAGELLHDLAVTVLARCDSQHGLSTICSAACDLQRR